MQPDFLENVLGIEFLTAHQSSDQLKHARRITNVQLPERHLRSGGDLLGKFTVAQR